MKKILSLLMVLTMVSSLFSVMVAYATDGTVVIDGVTFSKDMKILLNYPLDKTDETYIIPDSVIIIDENAFSQCVPFMNAKGYYCTGNEYLKNIYIPDSVKEIGNRAFAGCKNLQSINIPDSVTQIGVEAFYSCTGITSVELPEAITMIKGGTFENCIKLETIVVPNGVTTISSAFLGCKNLNSIVLPDSVTILSGTFSGCSNLKEIKIPKNVVRIESSTFSGCASLEYIAIPDGVTTLGDEVFSGCKNLKEIVIPDKITNIAYRAFYGCKNLENITIPASVTEIVMEAFSGCTSLKEIVIPEGVAIIYENTFKDCESLKSVTMPESLKSIYNGAFDNCKSLTDIYYNATEFEWNSITINSGNSFAKVANIHFAEPDKSEIKVVLYGKKLQFDQQPVIENGRTLVPLRAIFEALNANVAWDSETQTVRAIRYGTYIELQIGSNEMKVNNEIKYLDVPAKIINERTMVPARAIAEAFGCNVNWEAENNAVIIN